MANTLFLRLEAPLQSWGERGRWSVRDTAPEPTKSGVVGLLACALGWADDARIRNLARLIRVGVRCDRAGSGAPLVDYHTVGGGYRSPMLLTAEGKPKWTPRKQPHTEQTWRSYLCDASFLVAIQTIPTDSSLIAQLAEAVQSPVWPIFLGRKSCVPALPVFAGVGNHESLAAALLEIGPPARREAVDAIPQRVHSVLECDARDADSVRRRDQLESRQFWRHATRYSRDIVLEFPADAITDDQELT